MASHLRTLWFGTRGYEQWIKMPRIDMDRGLVGRSERSDHAGGGATVARSGPGHMEYAMEWNALTTDAAHDIRNILDGVYDTEQNRGLIYFVEPSAQDVNAFSSLWANPSDAARLGTPSLIKGVRPTLVATGANAFRLPPRSAQFTVVDGQVMNTFYAPIPPGHTAHFAFYGPSAQTDKILAIPYTGESAGAPAQIDILDNDDYGTGFTTLSGVGGVEFALADTAGTVTLTAAILQVIPTGSSPAPITKYLSGRGHSGCRVDEEIEQTLNRATPGRDRESLAARFVEQGSWL